jgi:hypothetical protein
MQPKILFQSLSYMISQLLYTVFGASGSVREPHLPLDKCLVQHWLLDVSNGVLVNTHCTE